MINKTIQYNLQDFIIFNNGKKFDFFVWNPDKTYIVIGRANKAESSVFTEKANRDGIVVLKRPSGGEAVILSPETIVISVKLTINNVLKTHPYFKTINTHLISALQKLKVQNLRMNGISDISVGERKILGSSIYRKSNTLFYHAVLNISESSEKIETYLKHPLREPDYRNGRSHKEFVTSLKKEGFISQIPIISEEIKHQLELLLTEQTQIPEQSTAGS